MILKKLSKNCRQIFFNLEKKNNGSFKVTSGIFWKILNMKVRKATEKFERNSGEEEKSWKICQNIL